MTRKIPAESPAPFKRLLPARAVADRYGVHLRTLARWEIIGALPSPDMRIGDRRYWDVETLDEADRERAHPSRQLPKKSSGRKASVGRALELEAAAPAAPAKRGRAR